MVLTRVTASAAPQRAIEYAPGLDGLRGIAVLSVALAHFGVPRFQGGGYGVDIFFVQSGFLITKVLLSNVGRGVPLSEFYWHRFIRLAPALLLVCSAVFLLPDSFLSRAQAWRDFFSSVLYVSNWTRAFPAGAPLYLGHTWSLSIEEQFYLLWPVILLGMLRFGKTKAVIGSFVLLVAAILWLFQVRDSGASLDRIYNGFDTHCGGLLVGCCLAQCPAPRVRGWMAAVAVALYIRAVTRTGWHEPGVVLIWGVAAVLILAATADAPDTIVKRVLGWRPLVKIGVISYSLYLWHYPIALALTYQLRMPPRIAAPLGLTASIALAGLTYVVVEAPLLRVRDSIAPATRQRLGRVTATFSAIGMVAGLCLFWSDDVLKLIHSVPITIFLTI